VSSSAVCFGINKYENSPLRGCVNDAVDIASALHYQYTWPMGTVRLCVDERATAKGMIERITSAIVKANSGDTVVISNSSHGAQYAYRSGSGEVDRLDELICPYGFDWADENTWLLDNKIGWILDLKKAGSTVIIISDSCHSDGLLRDSPNPGSWARGVKIGSARRLQAPPDLAWRKRSLPEGAPKRSLRTLVNDMPGVCLLSGCESSGTSSDAEFSGRPNGAFTWILLKMLAQYPDLPLGNIVEKCRSTLCVYGFEQKPQTSGDQNILDRPFPKYL